MAEPEPRVTLPRSLAAGVPFTMKPRIAGRRRLRTAGLAAYVASGLLAVALPAVLPAAGAWGADAGHGKALFGQCKRCHQADGAAERIPSITGWPRDDFVIASHADERGKRVHPVMQLLARRLSDEEIAVLAAFSHRAEDDR